MAPYNNENREVTYEIVEEIGVLSESSTGWKKELNVVSWNGGQAKYDIREWSPNHTQMSKGLTLNEREMRTIIDLLKRRARYVPRRSYPSQEETEETARVADSSAAAYHAEQEQEAAEDHMVETDCETTEDLETASELEDAADFENPAGLETPAGFETEEAQAETA